MVLTIGLDLGDRSSRYCALNERAEIVAEGSVGTARKAIVEKLQGLPSCRVGLVANARQVKLISESSRKTDRIDAEMLARMVRGNPSLLRPIRHRSAETQAVLTKVRVRATLVETRTSLINSVRSLAKVAGERVPACAADSLGDDGPERPAGGDAADAGAAGAANRIADRSDSEAGTELAKIARRDYRETEQVRMEAGRIGDGRGQGA